MSELSELSGLFDEKFLLKILYNLHNSNIEIDDIFDLIEGNTKICSLKLEQIISFYPVSSDNYYIYVYNRIDTDTHFIIIKLVDDKQKPVKVLYKDIECKNKCDCYVINIFFDNFDTLIVVKGYMTFEKFNNIHIIDTVFPEKYVLSRQIE